jgi:hypothetical protein
VASPIRLHSADLSSVFSMRVRASGVGAEKAIIKQFPSRLNIPFEATI